MMRPTQEVTVYLHRQPVDFRKAINGLSLIVQENMKLNPYSEALFVFINKNRTKLKLLYWERNGFCLWQKRLEKNKFAWPRHLEDDTVQLRTQELNWLLDGFDIWRMPPHQTLFYDCVG
jgi:transposase|tara:strand:+ start:453 stop:809 length:357 start_codon:yes stop_codon:yes gene_type:complete